MSFITQWIESHMEDMAVRDAAENRRLAAASKHGKQFREMAQQPVLGKQWWKQEFRYKPARESRMCGGSDGKQSRYMATPTSRANTYDSVLAIYNEVEQRRDAKRALKQQQQQL